jgi:molybdopterin-guanine dinucleotide biosynthesis protein A
MGRDKARLLVGHPPRPLVAHVASRLRRVADPVFLAPGRPGRLGPLPYRELDDEDAGHGPLAGIAAALAASPRPMVAVAAVDMPFVNPAVFDLLARIRDDEDAVVPQTEDGLQPLHAVFSTRALPAARAALAEGCFGVLDLLGRLAVRVVGPREWGAVDPEGRFAWNVNEPADLVAMRASPG